MKIENINIKNKQLNFVNQNIEFKKNGIYIVNGRNGSGKSTLIKSIIFDNGVVYKFNDKNVEDEFLNNKAGLVAYVDQNIYEYRITIEKFIKKGNDNIKTDEIKSLMNMLGLEYLSLKDEYYNLSGGEKHKLCNRKS